MEITFFEWNIFYSLFYISKIFWLSNHKYEKRNRASLVAQWERIYLPVQETQVRSLTWKIPCAVGQLGPCTTTSLCSRAWSHKYWAHEPQLLKPTCPRACAPQQGKLLQREACALQLESSPRSPQLEKSPCSNNKDPAQPKNSYTLKKKNDFIKLMLRNTAF